MPPANLHATMPEDDKKLLTVFTAEEGVSTAGFITAVIRSLADMDPAELEKIVKLARKIDGQRRRRSKPVTVEGGE